MSSSISSTSTVSAPGKVLLAGGYLVLDKQYSGLVIATDARFYTATTTRSTAQGEGAGKEEDGARFRVTARSPQFRNALWQYDARLGQVSGEANTLDWSLEQTSSSLSSAGRNPFVELAIFYALRLASELTSPEQVRARLSSSGTSSSQSPLQGLSSEPGSLPGIDIWVLGDNDFYSQRATLASHDTSSTAGPQPAPSTAALRALTPFASQDVPISQVHKTGLGSSAAMTTSLVGSLLLHLGALSSSPLTIRDRAIVHNAAQLVHCAAQGKVGSGFDVSAAIWGSHLYRRFDPAVLQPLMDAEVPKESSSEGAPKRPELMTYLSPDNALWHPTPAPAPTGSEQPQDPTASAPAASTSVPSSDEVARPSPLQLPSGLALALADVDTGSNTPSLVGKVLAWRKAKPEWAAQLYMILSSSNGSLADALLALRLAHAEGPQAYDQALEQAAARRSADWDALLRAEPSTALALLIEARNAMRSIRAGMRELGNRAGAPVEPDDMGALIRASIEGAPGILGGGVPGAGGFDALFVLYISPPSHLARVRSQMQTQSTQDGPSAITIAAQTAPAREAVERVWSSWRGLSVGPLLCSAGGAVGVPTENGGESGEADKQHAGLQIEQAQNVPGLLDAIRR